jgi:hypothetical protein
MAPGVKQADNQVKPSRGHASQACCLLIPHQGTPVSCNNIIFKAISNAINQITPHKTATNTTPHLDDKITKKHKRKI